MKRIPIVLIPVLLCWLQFGFAQTPGAAVEKQDPLKDSIEKYTKIGQYGKVVPLAEQWAKKVKMEKGEESPEYGGALNNWGDALNRFGKNKESEPILLQGLEIRKKALGENHQDVAASLNCLGHFYKEIGHYDQAVANYQRSLAIRKKTLGENHPEVAGSHSNLGTVYFSLGNYSKSEMHHLHALKLWKNTFGEYHFYVGVSANNLGNLYNYFGNYSKAESYLLQALQIWEKMIGKDHPNVGYLQNNLGLLYENMGNFTKAELHYLKAFEILKTSLSENHPSAAALLSNLGNLYVEMGLFTKAEKYYLYALKIRKNIFGEIHPEVGNSLHSLGNLKSKTGNYFMAGYYCLKANKILTETLGANHPEVAASFLLLGNINKATNHNQVAKNYYLKSLKITEKVLSANHHDVANSIYGLGTIHLAQGNINAAEVNFLNLNAILKNQFQNYFTFLSDQEKEKYYRSNILLKEIYFKSYCLIRYSSKKSITSDLYNNQMITKALLLSSSQKFKQRFHSIKDSSVLAKYESWEGLTNRIAKLYSSSDSTDLAKLKKLETEAEILEKELVRKSEDFATLADKKRYKWTDVQKKLKAGEAAIEMVRVRKYGISKIVTDSSDPKKPTYKIESPTDTAYYAALIVKPTSKYPEMVLLKNGNALEDRWIQMYKNSINKRIKDQTSYNQFWKMIDAKLGPTVKRVYFSPDGVYNSINLNTLQNPKTGKYLLDERDIRLVTNTKDIVTANVSKPNPAYACLVGFPDYNTDKAKRAAVFQRERNHPEAWYNLNLTRSDAFAELPATKTEVENISGLMQTNGWQVESLLGEDALEESIKAVQKPRVLHIATHGFFQPDTTKGSNPLIHSGLLLTGANKSLSGEKDDKVDDGILTAYEAMNLNLDNTDLVVLSACETGLGEIKNGEGVYGLQRAFKVAGAKSIIMSLWKVDDEATQELMVSFYKNWLNSPQTPEGGLKGKNTSAKVALSSPSGDLGGRKRSAFLKAQKELKAKYPNPYYWGAFVMVGE